MTAIHRLSDVLREGPDGIWQSGPVDTVSYPADGNEACYGVEEDSFWFRHRNACIETVVRAFPPAGDGAILDIGGGNGFVAAGLQAAGFPVILLEPGRAGAVNALRRGIRHVVCGTFHSAGFRPHVLAAAGMFDVLEHVPDDLALLESIAAAMRPGGRLYLTVPAYAALWSAEDVSAGHHRRYRPGSLHALLSRAGFDVEFASCIFRPLPPLILLLRCLPHRLGLSGKPGDARRRMARDHGTGGRRWRAWMEAMLRGEIRSLEARRPMRFGSSCLVVARLPDAAPTSAGRPDPG